MIKEREEQNEEIPESYIVQLKQQKAKILERYKQNEQYFKDILHTSYEVTEFAGTPNAFFNFKKKPNIKSTMEEHNMKVNAHIHNMLQQQHRE